MTSRDTWEGFALKRNGWTRWYKLPTNYVSNGCNFKISDFFSAVMAHWNSNLLLNVKRCPQKIFPKLILSIFSVHLYISCLYTIHWTIVKPCSLPLQLHASTFQNKCVLIQLIYINKKITKLFELLLVTICRTLFAHIVYNVQSAVADKYIQPQYDWNK